MKFQEIVFKRPIKVFQVFRHINVYGKAEKSFGPMPPSEIPNRCFHLNRKCLFDIFQIKYNEVIELHLHYKYFGVGTPTRENFKVGEIRLGKPIEIKINGKTDFSLTSRRARVFKEQTYIFNYIGDFSECKILKESFDFTLKRLPPDRKVVDLIKQLW